MMLGQARLSTKGYQLAGRSLAGNGPSLSALQEIRQKYGDGAIPKGDANQTQDIMATLVYPLFTDKDWQFCTINAWLTGTPSEDDLSWKAKYFSEMPRLEEVCGDHSFFNQFEAAFSDLKDKGAPKEVIDWLRSKGEAKIKEKVATAEKEGQTNVGKAAADAQKAINPFENPWVVGGIAAAVTLLLVMRLKK